jgi:hypothetical protein
MRALGVNAVSMNRIVLPSLFFFFQLLSERYSREFIVCRLRHCGPSF